MCVGYEAVLAGPTCDNRLESTGIIIARMDLDLEMEQSRVEGIHTLKIRGLERGLTFAHLPLVFIFMVVNLISSHISPNLRTSSF